MDWNSGPLPAQGFYWAVLEWMDDPDDKPEIVEVRCGNFYRTGTEVDYSIDEITHWMGPLPMPTIPGPPAA